MTRRVEVCNGGCGKCRDSRSVQSAASEKEKFTEDKKKKMGRLVKLLVLHLLILKVKFAATYTNVPANAMNPDSVVVAYQNISAPTGSEVILQCYSQRIVWTQDRLNDRQRVAHWDWFSINGEYKVDRVLDMFSAGDQRLYNSYNQGRVLMSTSAFSTGNFSLVIKDVRINDRGIYSCNLHHHYCHLYETVKIQLNITRSAKKVRKLWDGEKTVIVALVGSTVVLPCENHNHIWTERHSEEEQQVVHWDRSPPGVWHDQADRLIDLYASGEQRSYGPQFIRKRMNISDTAFADGDFSLTISNLSLGDEGIYSCDLHHHYCGIHERRIFNLFITDPVKVNFTQKSCLHYNVKTSQPRTDVTLNDFVIDTTDLRLNKNDRMKPDYKNNILKEKAAMSQQKVELLRDIPPKNLDRDFEKQYWK
ncbi:matrix remodeling-associated protein 8-like isoform X7 [Chiloscyllium punctatum]|uniref:matrix remodeling-associated protein 8-like isoform X7 n=1 Tax=Chiloscyllium punctatum TaxID=137246 RepID=UPI003B63BA88